MLNSQLKLLSYNISGGDVSALAPRGFALAQKHRAIAELVRWHAPHLVALQETFGLRLDGAPPNDEYDCSAEGEGAELHSALASQGYALCATARSHCGDSAVFACAALAARRVPLPRPAVGPAALARFKLGASGEPDLLVAGVHLAPFGPGAEERLAQTRAVLAAADRLAGAGPPLQLILAGDFNMRKAEDAALAALGLEDAFLSTARLRPNRAAHNYTWNSNVNKYHGAEQFAFTARFDRVAFRGGVAAVAFEVAEGEARGGPAGHYVSDHYAVVCTLDTGGKGAAGP
jgi:endonuclease/exonuclease/phosphatase family metal-dependent hydrolase